MDDTQAAVWYPSGPLVSDVPEASLGGPPAEVGDAVAIDGGTAVVGAPGASSASIFSSLAGAWEHDTTLHGPANFGATVAAANGTIAVGADRATQVHLFERDGRTWETAAILEEDAGRFGFSVAMDEEGTTLVVAARGEPTSVRGAGALYVYQLSSDGWQQAAQLTVEEPQTWDSLGQDVAVDGAGRTIVAGSLRDPGTVFVFERASGEWSQTATLTSGSSADGFGRAVDVSQSGIAVGAPFAEVEGWDTGAVYVFADEDGTWTQTTLLTPSDSAVLEPKDGIGFGNDVSMAAEILVVGAPYEDASPGQIASPVMEEDAVCSQFWWILPTCDRPGAAYVFQGTDGPWHQATKITAPDPAPGDHFGTSVALSEDGRDLVVGAPDWPAGQTGDGTAYGYRTVGGEQL